MDCECLSNIGWGGGVGERGREGEKRGEEREEGQRGEGEPTCHHWKSHSPVRKCACMFKRAVKSIETW